MHTFYISGVIKEAENYIDMIHIIRNASPADQVVIHINSVGGVLDTALQITGAMIESEASITCSVEGSCMSAATLIFLAADNFQVNEHSIFMLHNYSSGAYGKGGELFDQISHEKVWSTKLLNSVYAGFLTKKEIRSILDNKDIYMDAEEAIKRLKKRLKRIEKKNAQEKS